MRQLRLVYSSVANGAEPTYDYLASLVRQASANNARLGVTGILCYARGGFLQALEGEPAVVNQLFRKISQDTRHHSCEILSCNEIATREFADWTMRLVAMDIPPDVELDRMSGPDAEAYLAACASYERARTSTLRLPTMSGVDVEQGPPSLAPHPG